MGYQSIIDNVIMYIYLIRHKDSGKCYVGQMIKAPDVRFQQHKYRATYGGYTWKSAIADAIRKYGWDSFSRHVLQVCETREKLPGGCGVHDHLLVGEQDIPDFVV